MPEPIQLLLQTKLHRPRLPKDLVERTRLVEQLNHDIDLPLILVCAPAGFGKTTLVSTWLEGITGETGEKLPSAWLSLDEQDSDLNLFLRYFIAALRTIFAQACEETQVLLQARQQPPEAVLYATLSNELEKLPKEAILVLDDYHTIHGTEVHKLLGELVRHLPRPLHLVLISRTNPPIQLSNLRARGRLGEIRTRDLRFTPDETSAYLSKTQFALMSHRVLPMLEERFEGWPAGLHLAALSLRSADSQESVLAALSRENASITGYLVDEVLAHQVPAIHAFLLKTSILDRFSATLCEAVIGEIDPAWNARLCLEWIERSELFIIPLDDQREWYRYHHLFQELLQRRSSAELGADQVKVLHRRASTWFEEQGLLDEALHHALVAGDIVLAARQMGAGLSEVLNREDRPTLERWLHLLPEEMIQQQPGLLVIKLWVLEFTWRLNLQAQVLQQVEKLLDAGAGASLPANELQILRGQILVVKAQHAYFSNQAAQSIDLCRQALTFLPASWAFVRGGAMLFLSLSMQSIGQTQEVERLLLDEYGSYGDKSDAYALLLLRSLAFNYLNSGQLEQTRQIAQVLLQGAIRHKVAIQKNWGDWFLGLVSYHRNEIETAAQHFTHIIENRYTAQISTYRDAVAGLALIRQIKGENTEALQMLDSISQFDLEQRGSEDNRTRSLRARVQLLQGDLEGASNWVKTFSDLPPDVPLIWLEEPQVTRARILLARGTNSDLRSAQQILDVLEEIAERTHTTRYEIEILALRALALEALGDTDKASATLKKAIDLAQPGGFIRVFADLGKPMQAMLRRLEQQGHSMDMVQRILAAFLEDDLSLVSDKSPAQPRRQQPPGAFVLVEPLTPRELEVLNLLRGPASIKEIALKLNISYATAKRHTINLYAKLGANQRWEAVAKAEEFKILPPR
jgi:LuxR family maltose regulon positive regulatory protein